MSVKINQMLAAAALALGVTMTAGRAPIAEALLNDMTVKKLEAAEVADGTGRVVVFVTMTEDVLGTPTDIVRAVADAAGNVRLFGDGSAVVALSKRSNLVPGSAVRFVRFVKPASVGDPILSLKAKFKRIKAENATATAKKTDIVAKQSAAVSLGWDAAVGTPENVEYLDIVERLTTVTEWETVTGTIRASLSAALTAAGIDPATVV